VADPQPSAIFFIDETDAHGIGVETHLPMGLALFSMRYRINYYQLVRGGFDALSLDASLSLTPGEAPFVNSTPAASKARLRAETVK